MKLSKRPITLLYLHGFASAPSTSKVMHFQQNLGTNGNVIAPDLNVPNFPNLLLSEMLPVIDRAIATAVDKPLYIVASSLGALAALHYLTQYKQTNAQYVEKVVLLSPLIDFFATHNTAYGQQRLDLWS